MFEDPLTYLLLEGAHTECQQYSDPNHRRRFNGKPPVSAKLDKLPSSHLCAIYRIIRLAEVRICITCLDATIYITVAEAYF